MNVARFLRHVVVVAARTGVNATGDPSFGPRRKLAARVEQDARKVVAVAGKEVFSRTQILTLERIGEEDRVWTADVDAGDDNAARTPVAVNQADPVRGGKTLFMTHL